MMNNAPVEIRPEAGPPKGRVDKAHRWLTLISTSLGICGGLGTLFVWLTANFYTGGVDVSTAQPVKNLIIKVYDRRGQEAIYHTPHFELMPGTYHLEIGQEGESATPAEVSVKFGARSVVALALPDRQHGPEPGGETKKHHWWQFWRG